MEPRRGPQRAALPRRDEDLAFHQERVGLAFCADRGQLAVAGDYYGFIRQGQDGVVQGAENLLHGAAGEVGAADRPGEEGVTGDQLFFGLKVEADAAFGVAGSVEDLGGERSGGDRFSGRDAAVDFDFARGAHADPRSLHVQHFQKSIIVLVEQNGSAGGGAEFHGSANVVDVGVGDDDLFDLEIVLADESENVVDVVAGIDHHGLVGSLVADDGAVALEGADGKDFVDHWDIV